MALVEPVTLSGSHVRLEPLAREHEAGIKAAAADGKLWQLWYTSVPTPDRTLEWIDAALAMRDQLGAMPFTVREPSTGDIVGSTRYFNVDAAHRRLEIGHTWYAKRVQRTALNTEAKLLLLTHAFETLALHRRRVPHELLQLRLARGHRAPRREAGRHPAPSPAPAGRVAARHRRVQHHRAANGRR